MKAALPMPPMPKVALFLSGHGGLFVDHSLPEVPAQMVHCPPSQSFSLASQPVAAPPMYPTDGCFILNNGTMSGRAEPSSMLSQQQQQMNNNNSGSHHHHHHPQQQQQQQYQNDEENVGSLLRLVYSCPDQILEQDSAYVDQNQFFHQHIPSSGQIKAGSIAQDTLMEYPMLEGIPLEYL
jgi:hypothetical protein